MQTFKTDASMRFFFLVTGSIILAGIWLTGFSGVHWLLYLPAVFFYLAAVSAICPGLIVSRLMFGSRAGP